ncbi:MAG: IclR family transcriptional regulator [Candidatus Rokubacteria bacterium]|nr:IclR family transcriptional regulator [Candidatus Rokubacteria bacterium]
MRRPTNGLAGVKKALLLLSQFTEQRPALTGQELSQLVRLPLSTTYRLMRALRDLELLEYDRVLHKYLLGSKLFELGSRFYKQLDVVRRGRPVMERLVRDCRETVLMTRQHGGRVICVDKIESLQTILFSIEPGTELPLYKGAASKVLLAFLSEAELQGVIRGVVRARGRGGRPPAGLHDELERIRKRGYAFTSGEVVADAWAVSVPVFDSFGRIAAGVSVAGPVHRLVSEQVEPLARRLMAGAEEISLALGARLISARK